MIRAVLDTNVLASGFASAGGTPGQLLTWWGAASYELVVSAHILQEVERTLAKPYFRERYGPNQAANALERLKQHAVMTAISVDVHGVATHPEDDLVLATAVSAWATMLVTGDRRLREIGDYRGVTIVTPREFLSRLERQANEQS
jgi:putative PIN family toxin of toxin-antitoxin system